MDNIFGTPATNPMARTTPSMGTQNSPLASRYGGHGIAMYSSAPMLAGIVDPGFQGGLGDGTIYVACIAQAGPEMLLGSQNPAYIAATHRNDVLASQIQQLEGQLAGQKQALAEVLSKVPMLLGIPGAQGTTESNPPAPQTRCPCTGKTVLGLSLEYPVAPRSRPPGIKYWSKEDYNGRAMKRGRKGGQHKNNENVGQVWVEDDNGNIIDGYVTGQIRDILTACLHSLVWSGQATPHSRELGHEAHIYIHTVLGHHFRFLVTCEGGQWKINELLTAAYSNFTQTHLGRKKQDTKETSSGKHRRADSIESTPVSDAPCAKAPRSESAQDPSHNIPTASSAAPIPIPLHPLLEADLYVFDDHQSNRLPSLSPALLTGINSPDDNALSPPIATSLLPTPAVLSPPQQPSPSTLIPALQQATSAMAPSEVHDHPGVTEAEPNHPEIVGAQPEHCTTQAAALPTPDPVDGDNIQMLSGPDMPSVSAANSHAATSTVRTPNLPQIPVPKPFPVMKCRTQQADLPGATSPVVGQSPAVPVEATVTPAAHHQPHLEATSATQTPAANTPSTGSSPVAQAPTGNGATTAVTVPGPQSSRCRGPTPVKASAKYKANTISAQSFHMCDRMDENPDISYTDCQTMFKALSSEQLQVYNERVVAAKKQRKEDQADQAKKTL